MVRAELQAVNQSEEDARAALAQQAATWNLALDQQQEQVRPLAVHCNE